ncbi:MAG: prenyltransferase [Acidimicrobiales bacterium]
MVELPGVVSAAELAATVDFIASCQLRSGMIPWFEGGHADPWNHTEAAMALSAGGERAAAEAAFDWLVGAQRPDGAWHQYYLADRVEHDKLDANVCAYPAAGVWHHWLCTGDRGFAETLWPTVERAIEFVLGLQTERGEILWARHSDGRPWPFALLTGSSSISHSLRCALALASLLGYERPRWERALERLCRVIAEAPEAFAPKHRWAMDWYYPVLAGVVTGEEARARLDTRRAAFVMGGRGVRCVSDRPWVTAAETCECAIAHLAAGEHGRAVELYMWAQTMRLPDGRYWTGIVHPQQDSFPAGEQSTYTAAAVVLAAEALSAASPAATLFTGSLAAPSPKP